MSLVSAISALATAVQQKLNTMTPRLLPAGGTTGQALRKTSGADNATAWANDVRSLQTIISGTPTAGALVGGGIVPQAGTIDTSTSSFTIDTAPSASLVLNIKKNGAALGTVTFASGANTGTISLTSTALAANDRISIYMSATAPSAISVVGSLVVR